MKILRAARLGSNFAGSHKKKTVCISTRRIVIKLGYQDDSEAPIDSFIWLLHSLHLICLITSSWFFLTLQYILVFIY